MSMFRTRMRFILTAVMFIILGGAAAAYLHFPNSWWSTERMLRALRSANDLHRMMSADLLKDRAANSKAVIPALVLALGDTWDEVRGSASSSLCAIGSPAVPYLSEALLNKNEQIRIEANRTLSCVNSTAGNQ